MINKTEIFRKIGAILAELNEQHEYITRHPESLNALELELFAANAEFLTENARILRRFCESESAHTKPAALLPTSPEVHELPASTLNTADPSTAVNSGVQVLHTEITPEEKTSPITPTVNKPIVVEEERIVVPVVPPAPVQTPAPVEVAESVTPDTLAFNDLKKVVDEHAQDAASAAPNVTRDNQEPRPAMTLNEMLSAQRTQGASAPRYGSAKVTDLRSAISLNDKLVFIRELFNGYSLAYSEAIEIVNRTTSMDEARKFLEQNYAAKNNWEAKQEAVNKLYEILQRKFDL